MYLIRFKVPALTDVFLVAFDSLEEFESTLAHFKEIGVIILSAE